MNEDWQYNKKGEYCLNNIDPKRILIEMDKNMENMDKFLDLCEDMMAVIRWNGL